MIQLNANDALPIAKDRVAAPNFQSDMISKAGKLWNAAFDLWNDEFQSYMTLTALGHHSAAKCAWQRRMAAVQLTSILQSAF